MELFGRIIISAIGIFVSVMLIKHRRQVMDWTGHWTWADKYVGGTANAIVLIALVILFGSIAYPTGAIDDIIKPQPKTPEATQQVIPN